MNNKGVNAISPDQAERLRKWLEGVSLEQKAQHGPRMQYTVTQDVLILVNLYYKRQNETFSDAIRRAKTQGLNRRLDKVVLRYEKVHYQLAEKDIDTILRHIQGEQNTQIAYLIYYSNKASIIFEAPNGSYMKKLMISQKKEKVQDSEIEVTEQEVDHQLETEKIAYSKKQQQPRGQSGNTTVENPQRERTQEVFPPARAQRQQEQLLIQDGQEVYQKIMKETRKYLDMQRSSDDNELHEEFAKSIYPYVEINFFPRPKDQVGKNLFKNGIFLVAISKYLTHRKKSLQILNYVYQNLEEQFGSFVEQSVQYFKKEKQNANTQYLKLQEMKYGEKSQKQKESAQVKKEKPETIKRKSITQTFFYSFDGIRPIAQKMNSLDQSQKTVATLEAQQEKEAAFRQRPALNPENRQQHVEFFQIKQGQTNINISSPKKVPKRKEGTTKSGNIFKDSNNSIIISFGKKAQHRNLIKGDSQDHPAILNLEKKPQAVSAQEPNSLLPTFLSIQKNVRVNPEMIRSTPHFENPERETKVWTNQQDEYIRAFVELGCETNQIKHILVCNEANVVIRRISQLGLHADEHLKKLLKVGVRNFTRDRNSQRKVHEKL